MWEGTGSASRSLFSRAKARHVFLFEKVVIFSKKIEAPTVQKKANKADNYLYKGHLQVMVVLGVMLACQQHLSLCVCSLLS